MTFSFVLKPQRELAPGLPASLDRARARGYGRSFEDFVPGQVFVHPRGATLNPGLTRAFATAFMQANPIYLNADYARAHGFADTPASPQLVFNLVLSLGVQNDSEKVVANLGYHNASFLRPVYPADTLRALTRVVSRRDRGGEPGIVRLQSLGLNHYNEVVLQYEREILVPLRGDRPAAASAGATAEFPWQDAPSAELPLPGEEPAPAALTGRDTYFEDFTPGDILVHPNGRTITDEHIGWACAVGNTHPLHSDRVYTAGLSGALSGEPVVCGGLVFAWLEGLASRDVSENALFDLGFTEGYHTQPAFTGDTVAALSRVLAAEEGPEESRAGILTLQLVGVKNLSARQALEQYGAGLFVKEQDKKKLGQAKIPGKIFEIERRLLVKRKPR